MSLKVRQRRRRYWRNSRNIRLLIKAMESTPLTIGEPLKVEPLLTLEIKEASRSKEWVTYIMQPILPENS